MLTLSQTTQILMTKANQYIVDKLCPNGKTIEYSKLGNDEISFDLDETDE